MVVCIGIYVLLFVALWLDKGGKWLKRFRKKEKRILFLAVLAANVVATALFGAELLQVSLSKGVE